jgi:hypothetical protein
MSEVTLQLVQCFRFEVSYIGDFEDYPRPGWDAFPTPDLHYMAPNGIYVNL